MQSAEKEGRKMSEEARLRLSEIVRGYPSPQSAVMQALHLVQEELGWITPEAMEWVAEQLDLAPSHVREVASFYTMYRKRPVGRYHVQICRTLSCMLSGAVELRECVEKRLGIKPGEVSENGMWSFEEVECLGSCGSGPMAQINDVFFEHLDSAKFNTLVDRIEREKPDLTYSTMRGELGGGMADHPRSSVYFDFPKPEKADTAGEG